MNAKGTDQTWPRQRRRGRDARSGSFWRSTSVWLWRPSRPALGDSSALIANGLDNLSDSFVYVTSLFALSRSGKWKRGAANVSGGLLILFALGILYDAWRRYVDGSDPLETIMIAMALIAAAINAVCVWLLARLREPDVNIRAANTFSWNDFAANLGIVVAGGLVAWLGTNWPDLVVGVVVAGIAAWGGVDILRDNTANTIKPFMPTTSSDRSPSEKSGLKLQSL